MSAYNPQKRGHGSRNPRPTSKPVEVTFYANKAENELHPQLLYEWAEEQAKLFPEGRDKVSKSQIRRFFGAIKNLQFQLESQRPWGQILPLFKMFHSKVCYAERAGNKKIPKEFADFLKENMKKVGDDKDDFIAFVMYFEAVLGFAYGHNKIGRD